MLPSAQFRDVTIRDYIVVLKRRFWVILACFIISSSWFSLQTFKKAPLYKASAKILIERNMPQILPVQQIYQQPFYGIDKEYIQSQIDILTSRVLAKKAVESLLAEEDTTFIRAKTRL
ncbi:MAG TPA: Wzz/FepE/Etk N-terminal domain-containing protein [Candidatus Omnitrophota bacterium]|nr:Wzz/FepE/Etk N-terminal domain-containing protein [Candidatus Omnitrophota bacterium]